MLQIKQIKMK